MVGTKANNASELGLHDFKGRWFSFATYAEKAKEIEQNKERMAELAAAMSDEELDSALLGVKVPIARMGDVAEVLKEEMKSRIENHGATFPHFYLDCYDRMGEVDWVAIGKATGMTKEKARATFAGTKPVKALKPK